MASDAKTLDVKVVGTSDTDWRIRIARTGIITPSEECACIEIWPNEVDHVIRELERLRGGWDPA